MASPSGAQYVFYDDNPNGVRIALTPDGSDLPAPVPGATNIEIFTATPGQIGAGYQASAFTRGASADGATVFGASSLQLLTGNVGVRSPNDFPIIPGNGNQTIVGAGGDSIVAVSGGTYASPGNTQILLGNDAATVIGSAGDTITGTAGSSLIDARSGNLAVRVGSAGGSDTIDSGSAVTVRGGAANATIVGAAGDFNDFTGSTGKSLILANGGNEVVKLGAGAATVVGGAGDTISAGSSGAAYIDALAGNLSIELGSSMVA